MRLEVGDDRVHVPHVSRNPPLDLLQQVDPVDGAPTGIVTGQCLARRWPERPEDVALAALTVVDFLRGPLSGVGGLVPLWRLLGAWWDKLLVTEAFGRLRPHFVEVRWALRRRGVERLGAPPLGRTLGRLACQIKSLDGAIAGLRPRGPHQSGCV